MVVFTVTVVSLWPTSLVLVTPGVRSRSPYCSKLRASWEARLKLLQQETSRAFAKASRPVRTDGNPALWDTPRGRFWIPDHSGTILFTFIAQEERRIYGSLKSGAAVLDVGAYIGTWTRQALGEGARMVVAIEPSPQSVECLRRNLAAEITENRVIMYCKGIWDSEGTVPLFENTRSGVGNSFVEESTTFRLRNGIPVTTIDRMTGTESRSRGYD
jgi:FkbM family methyltransferase